MDTSAAYPIRTILDSADPRYSADPFNRCHENEPVRGYLCTREKGHDGEHVAHTSATYICAAWGGPAPAVDDIVDDAVLDEDTTTGQTGHHGGTLIVDERETTNPAMLADPLECLDEFQTERVAAFQVAAALQPLTSPAKREGGALGAIFGDITSGNLDSVLRIAAFIADGTHITGDKK